jgi:hypothetical protein
MPSLNCPTSPHDGARVTVRIGLGAADILRLRRANRPIPQPVTATALIDTGAECTCVDPAIIQQLGIGWRGVGLIGAPAAANVLLGTTSYEVGFTVVHPSGDVKLDYALPTLNVEELSGLSQFGIDALIGRDVLASCVVVYDGPAGSVTLAY